MDGKRRGRETERRKETEREKREGREGGPGERRGRPSTASCVSGATNNPKILSPPAAPVWSNRDVQHPMKLPILPLESASLSDSLTGKRKAGPKQGNKHDHPKMELPAKTLRRFLPGSDWRQKETGGEARRGNR